MQWGTEPNGDLILIARPKAGVGWRLPECCPVLRRYYPSPDGTSKTPKNDTVAFPKRVARCGVTDVVDIGGPETGSPIGVVCVLCKAFLIVQVRRSAVAYRHPRISPIQRTGVKACSSTVPGIIPLLNMDR